MSETIDYSEMYGFAPAKRAGNLVFCSGVIGMRADGTTPDEPLEQYRLAFAALEDVLKAEGLTSANVVEMTSFHTNYPEHMEAFAEAKKSFLQGTLPAWTAIGVASLGDPNTLVEVRVTAAA